MLLESKAGDIETTDFENAFPRTTVGDHAPEAAVLLASAEHLFSQLAAAGLTAVD